MKRTISILALVALGACALPTTASWKVFQAKYKIEKESKIGTATCLNCHLSKKGGKLNPYGLDLKAALKAESTKKLTPEILAKVEGLDSTKSGKTNIAKIKADIVVGEKD
ncbi:MAG: hypothetical protein P4L46_18710 [Fimbriimonas sp.]|nr:hypothetical protein [Fimbriimonas sp.]